MNLEFPGWEATEGIVEDEDNGAYNVLDALNKSIHSLLALSDQSEDNEEKTSVQCPEGEDGNSAQEMLNKSVRELDCDDNFGVGGNIEMENDDEINCNFLLC